MTVETKVGELLKNRETGPIAELLSPRDQSFVKTEHGRALLTRRVY